MKFKKIKIKKNQRLALIYLSVVLFLLLIIFFFSKQLLSVGFAILLIAVGSMSNVLKRITGFNLGIEFITFSTILFFYSYGLTFGLIACAVMIIISSLSIGRISPEVFTGFMMYCIIGLLSLFLNC